MKLNIEFDMHANITHTLAAEDLQLLRYELQKEHGEGFTPDQAREAVNEFIEARYPLAHVMDYAEYEFDWRLAYRGNRSVRDELKYLHQALQDTPYVIPEIEGQVDIFDALEQS